MKQSLLRAAPSQKERKAEVAGHAINLDCEAVYWELWRPNVLGKAFYEGLAAEKTDDLAVMRLAGKRLTVMA